MNILFVYTLVERPLFQKKALDSWTKIQLGISYLSAMLKKAGHRTELVIPRPFRIQHDIDKILREFQPEVVCFTSVASKYPTVEKIANYIRKKASQAFLVIGGPHASLQPRELEKGPYDAICVGEGEYPMVEMAEALEKNKEPTGISNMWIRKGGSFERNKNRDFVENLDKLPFPDRELWKPWVKNDRYHMILSGRGCPWNCTYCCNHAFRRLARGKYFRHRSQSNIMKEVAQLCEDFPDVSHIYFEIETIAAHPSWIFKLCNILEEFNASRKTPLHFGTNIRARRATSFKPLFEAMRRAGFTEINLGIESGSERLRVDILRRLETNEDLIRTCDEARQAGLQINAYNMIGIPGESIEDFHQTIELNRRCSPDRNYLSIFYPYPGTHLHRFCIESGIPIKIKKERLERFTPVLRLPGFSKRMILHYFRWFDWYVYSGNRTIVKILSQALYRTLGAHHFLFQIFRFVTSIKVIARLRHHTH
jgi:radical SAM superfamily enzyme YgiQ (UPF0313 family)